MPTLIPERVGPRRLTYLNVLELFGRDGPASARERNLLNIVACLPRCDPLASTLAVVDRGQALERAPIMFDGAVATLAQNSAMHVMRTGSCLTTAELAALMGLRLERLDVRAFTSRAFNARLGQSIHVSVMGSMLLALVAPLLHQPAERGADP